MSDRPYAIVATFGVILAAVYSLWAFQRAFTGKPRGENAKMQATSPSARLIVVVPLLGAEPVPRPLPEAGARPHRAHGEARDRPARAEDRLPRAEADKAAKQRRAPPPRRREDAERKLASEEREVILAADRSPITPPDVDWLGDRARARGRRRRGAHRAAAGAAAPPAARPRRSRTSSRPSASSPPAAMLFWQWQRVQRRRPDHHHGGHGARRRLRRVPRRRRPRATALALLRRGRRT